MWHWSAAGQLCVPLQYIQFHIEADFTMDTWLERWMAEKVSCQGARLTWATMRTYQSLFTARLPKDARRSTKLCTELRGWTLR